MYLTDGQMYQNQLDNYLELVKKSIDAYFLAKTLDHQGLAETTLGAVELSCDFVSTIIHYMKEDSKRMEDQE